jgi:hypothetical protein
VGTNVFQQPRWEPMFFSRYNGKLFFFTTTMRALVRERPQWEPMFLSKHIGSQMFFSSDCGSPCFFTATLETNVFVFNNYIVNRYVLATTMGADVLFFTTTMGADVCQQRHWEPMFFSKHNGNRCFSVATMGTNAFLTTTLGTPAFEQLQWKPMFFENKIGNRCL